MPPQNAPLRRLMHRGVLRRRKELFRRFRGAKPFRHVVIDGFLDPAFCRRLLRSFPKYDAKKFKNEHGHLGKAHYEGVRGMGPDYRKLDDLLRSPFFLELVAEITGIPGLVYDPGYFGGGTHENLDDMELDPHVDFTLHPETGLYRRVNILLYLNPEWDTAWGGCLELHTNPWLHPSKNPIKLVPPLFNRCVIFETHDHSWHGFEAIRLPRGKKKMSRRSFALYLYTREAPEDFRIIPSDLTVFVDRPLPDRFRPGLTLSEEDTRLLERLIIRRDWKLKYLYDLGIGLSNLLEAARKQPEPPAPPPPPPPPPAPKLEPAPPPPPPRPKRAPLKKRVRQAALALLIEHIRPARRSGNPAARRALA